MLRFRIEEFAGRSDCLGCCVTILPEKAGAVWPSAQGFRPIAGKPFAAG